MNERQAGHQERKWPVKFTKEPGAATQDDDYARQINEASRETEVRNPIGENGVGLVDDRQSQLRMGEGFYLLDGKNIDFGWVQCGGYRKLQVEQQRLSVKRAGGLCGFDEVGQVSQHKGPFTQIVVEQRVETLLQR